MSGLMGPGQQHRLKQSMTAHVQPENVNDANLSIPSEYFTIIYQVENTRPAHSLKMEIIWAAYVVRTFVIIINAYHQPTPARVFSS